jgi:hypothetical protein
MAATQFQWLGHLVTEQVPVAVPALVTFDALGHTTTEQAPVAVPALVTFDALGHTTTEQAPVAVPALVTFSGLGHLSYAVKTGESYWFSFSAYPAPALFDLYGADSGISVIPVTLTSSEGLVHDPNLPLPISLQEASAIINGAVLYVPRRDYLFEFGVEPSIVKIPYVFAFDVLKKGAEGGFSYNVIAALKTVQMYDQWYLNILLTDKPYVSYGFSFVIKQPGIFYDFMFEVGELVTHYDFTFNVGELKRETTDFEWDSIESWIPVTLPCTAMPVRPNMVPPSAKIHRLNIRVYVGPILVGAGYTTYAWAGPDDAEIRFTITDIPQLSADHRIMVYDNNLKVYDKTLPYSEFWGDSYGTT